MEVHLFVSLVSPLSPLEVGLHSLVFSFLLAMFHPRSALNQIVYVFFLMASHDLKEDNLVSSNELIM